jgi:hypothetical protein
MNMVRMVTSLAIIAPIAASAQRAPTSKHSPVQSILVDRSRPYVYLEIERIGPRSPIRQDEPRLGVFLRFHNNCIVPVILATFGGSEPRPNEVGVLDTVVANQVQDEPVMTISQLPTMSSEDSRTKTGGETSPGQDGDSGAPETNSMDSMPRGYEAFHLRSLTTVAPGQSIYFSLPLNHIGPTWHAEIPFYFSKEAIPFYIGTNGKSRIRGASNHVSLYEEDVRATVSASARGGSSAPQ